MDTTATSSLSSPPKSSRRNHAAHLRPEVQAYALPKCVTISDIEFWKELHYNPDDISEQDSFSDVRPKEDFHVYMNKISHKIRADIYPGKSLITFHDKGSTSPLDHPTGTSCRPDFVASFPFEEKIHWADVEATVEIHSSGTNATEGPRQAIAYTCFLLQARPDRVSVQGMYVDKYGVILFIVNSSIGQMSPKLDLTNAQHVQLIYAFVRRLYEPHQSMRDPTIQKSEGSTLGHSLFDITLRVPKEPKSRDFDVVKCFDYRIHAVSSSFGQRTHVFVNNENPAKVHNKPIPVIKDQYREPLHRFEEDEIIYRIHEDEEIPGVVHIAHSELVLHSDGSQVATAKRFKTRICMTEYGVPLMELKTPKEVLIAIYDLLEVTRFMYFKCNVLHRDISSGNVLHIVAKTTSPSDDIEETDEKAPEATPSVSEDGSKVKYSKHKFCSIKHLLDQRIGRYATSTLLVDFDRGEILGRKDKDLRVERTGTPRFMAKALRKEGPHGDVGVKNYYENAPKLLDPVSMVYEKIFPDRVTRFPSSEDEHSAKVGVADKSLWRHQLYHDAESAYWLLVWWAVTASPQGYASAPINSGLWAVLNDTTDDGRHPDLLDKGFHPLYMPLRGLLKDLGRVFQKDIHWATKEPFIHPEFLHEVFQRHLLNFIVANQAEDFMSLPKAKTLRRPDSVTAAAGLTMEEINTLRSGPASISSFGKRSRTVESEPESDSSQKKAKKSKTTRK